MGCQPLSAHMLGTHLIPILSNGHSHPRHLQLTLPYRESDVIYATNLKRVCFLTLVSFAPFTLLWPRNSRYEPETITK